MPRAWTFRSSAAGPSRPRRPVGLQLDSYHLDYFTTKVHFGAHFAAMYGYDDTHAYLIDTAQQGGTVTTTLTSLERARNQRGPMTARNLSYTIASPTGRPDLGDAIRAAIRNNAHAFLNPPIANLGHRSIAKASTTTTSASVTGCTPRSPRCGPRSPTTSRPPEKPATQTI